MEAALRLKAWVQPGGRIEIEDSQLPAGNAVDVIVLMPDYTGTTRRSVVDVLAEAPGHLAFRTADEVDAYVREERDGWER